MRILVTAGGGFVGSNFVLDWFAQSDELVINRDRLTYAGNIEILQSLNGDLRHVFLLGDIGGWNEKPNLEIVRTVCALLDELSPRADGKPYKEEITYVADRPGHDRRYAIDASRVQRELGWKPDETFETGIHKTVQWYLNSPEWMQNVQSGEYQSWLETHYRKVSS